MREAGVIIVGGGHAGGRAAERLRAAGYDRPITVISEDPLPPYERPPLSKAVLAQESEPAPPYLIAVEKWNVLDVELCTGVSAQSIDRSTKTVSLSSGKVRRYDTLVLATGLKPRNLAAFQNLRGRVHTLHSFEDAQRIRDALKGRTRLLLVGAGFIGMEIAASARQRGAHVTVVEAAMGPMLRLLPQHIARWVSALHRREGVVLHYGRKVASAEESDGCAHVTLDDGAQIAADLIVVGVGGQPNDALAKEAGLDVDDGIRVDSACRTSDPSIFAVGDIARHDNRHFTTNWRLESWKNAEDTAAIAARAICGEDVSYNQVPWFWTDQYSRNIQIVGVPSRHLAMYERGEIGDSGYLAYFLDGDMLRGAVGIDCGRDIRKARGIMEKAKRLDARELLDARFRPADALNILAAEEV